MPRRPNVGGGAAAAADEPVTAAVANVESIDQARVPAVSRVSLSQSAYEKLREDLIAGVLRPNERVVEGEQSQRLGVSRTPVRDALMRLEAEGLVDSGRRGWTVHEFSRTELQDIYETRVALEGAAAALAAVRATDAQLAEIEALLDSEQRDLDETQRFTVERNAEFHSTVTAACGNPRLIGLVELNRHFYFNQRVRPLFTTEELRQSLQGHYEVLDALKRRQPERAHEVVRGHLMDGLTIILRAIHH